MTESKLLAFLHEQKSRKQIKRGKKRKNDQNEPIIEYIEGTTLGIKGIKNIVSSVVRLQKDLQKPLQTGVRKNHQQDDKENGEMIH